MRKQWCLSVLIILLGLSMWTICRNPADCARRPCNVWSGADLVTRSRTTQPPVQSAPAILYTLTVDGQRARHFRVHIVAPRTQGNTVEFAIPAWTPGYYQILHYESAIDRVTARDEAGRQLQVSHPSARVWRVQKASAAGASISVDYDVAGSDKGFGFFGSALDERRRTGYINGASAFMYVQGLVTSPVSLSLALPPGWKCAVPLRSTAPLTFAGDSYDALADTPLQIGDFDTYEFEVASTKFQCILVGDKRVNPGRLTRALSKVAEEAIGVFRSAPFKQYLFIYHLGEEGFIGGLEHCNSTVIHLDDPIGDADDDDFLTTSTHELFHAWNVKRIRPRGLGPFDYSRIVRTPSLWFAEGVTDYYADLLPVRAGLRKKEWFTQQLAERIGRLDSAPARAGITLEQASNRAWEGQSEGFAGLSYYLKGSLVGWFFDLRIRQLSGGHRSLDDVLRYLDRTYGERDTPYPPNALAEALSGAAGRDQTATYAKYISGTEDIRWEDVLPSAGFVLTRQEDGYLGVNFVPELPVDETDDRDDVDRAAIVQRVDAGYPAAVMNLQPGDRVITIDGRPVDYGLASAVIRSLPAAVPVRIAIVRHGRTMELTGNAGTQYSHHTLRLMPEADQSPSVQTTIKDLFASRAMSALNVTNP